MQWVNMLELTSKWLHDYMWTSCNWHKVTTVAATQ